LLLVVFAVVAAYAVVVDFIVVGVVGCWCSHCFWLLLVCLLLLCLLSLVLMLLVVAAYAVVVVLIVFGCCCSSSCCCCYICFLFCLFLFLSRLDCTTWSKQGLESPWKVPTKGSRGKKIFMLTNSNHSGTITKAMESWY
jgi:hypothetical protein